MPKPIATCGGRSLIQAVSNALDSARTACTQVKITQYKQTLNTRTTNFIMIAKQK